MPVSPYARYNLNDDDDDESETGITSESGIYTFDGQHTVATRSQFMQESNRMGQAPDDTLDYGSVVSGIEDSIFLMNESLYHSKFREEEARVRSEFSLDEESLDLGEYTKMPYPNENSMNLNDSTAAVMRRTNPTTTAEDSIFSAAYTRVMKSFLFPSTRKQNNEDQDAENGKTTPKTLSPKDSTDDVQRFQDDEASQDDDSVLQRRPAKTIIVGKSSPRTPKQRLDDYNNHDAQTPRTLQGSTMTIYSDTKILGLRLSRLLCIILLILVAAVGVAVGAALALQENASSTNRSAVGNEQNTFRTDGPVGPVVQTLAPSTTSVNDSVDETDAFTFPPTSLSTSLKTSSPIVGTWAPSPPVPTEVPSFPLPTPTPTITMIPSRLLPTGAPTVVNIPPSGLPTLNPTTTTTTSAPVNICGVDDDATTFVLFNENRNCVWFR